MESQSIQSLTTAFAISTVPIVAVWTALLQHTGIWSDLVSDYRQYYSSLDSYVLDYFFVVFYVLGFTYLIQRLGQAGRPRWQLALAFFAWIALLDLGVALLVKTVPGSGRYVTFFRGWAKKAGWRAIAWDIIYLSAIVAIAYWLPTRLVSSNEFWIGLSLLIIIGLIGVY